MVSRLFRFALPVLTVGFLLVSGGCRTAPPASPGSGPLTLTSYLAVVNGNGGYLSFVSPGNGAVFAGPAVGAIYPQAVKSCGRRLVVVNSSGNNLAIFDSLAPNVRLGTVSFPPGTNPVDLVFDGCDTAFVSCFDANSILKVDLVSMSVAATLAVPASQGAGPDGLALVAGRLYVGFPGFGSGNTVGVVDPVSFSFAPSSPVTVGENPQSLLEADGLVHAICTSGYNPDWTNRKMGSVHLIDPAHDVVVRTVDLSGSDPAFAAIAGNGRVFVSGWESGLMCYDAASGAVIRGPSNPVARPASGGLMGLAASGDRVWACSFMEDAVREYDAASFAPTASYPVGSQPGVLCFVP